MADLIAVCDTHEIPEGAMRRFTVGEEDILVAKVDGMYYALDDRCGHMSASLCDGALEGATVTCPLHAARFDVRDGQVVRPSEPRQFTARHGQMGKQLAFIKTRPVRSHPVVVEGGTVYIKR